MLPLHSLTRNFQFYSCLTVGLKRFLPIKEKIKNCGFMSTIDTHFFRSQKYLDFMFLESVSCFAELIPSMFLDTQQT
jgi:hypothetical protein